MPDSRFVHANGINIHYLDWRGGGPTVLCLHGITSQAHTWDQVAEALSPRYRVIAMDQRGHGDTDKPSTGYSPKDQVADVDLLAQALGINQFILMGHSMGGRVAGYYAGLHPQRLLKLILEDPPFPRKPGVGRSPIHDREERRPAKFANLDAAVAYLSSESDLGSTQAYAGKWGPEVMRKRVQDAMRQRADGAWEWKYSQAAVLAILEQGQINGDGPIMELAGQVTCPTLLVRGAESQVCTVENGRAIQAAFPNCRTVTIPEVSHGIHAEQFERFMVAVEEFLAE
jgi:pimeloyl-ACP methyl ester carboxylesterase